LWFEVIFFAFLEHVFKLEELWGSRDLVLKVGDLKARSGFVYSRDGLRRRYGE
jgi:hypothetical protein